MHFIIQKDISIYTATNIIYGTIFLIVFSTELSIPHGKKMEIIFVSSKLADQVSRLNLSWKTNTN